MLKKVKVICPNCDGTGIDPEKVADVSIDEEKLTANNDSKCNECNGTGFVEALKEINK